MQRYVKNLFVSCICITVFGVCPMTHGVPFVLRTASSMEKLFQNSFKDNWISKGTDTAVAISACRNESESFQLVIIPFEDLNKITWDVKSDDIPSQNIKIQPVGYVNIDKPSQPRFGPNDGIKDIRTGLWPDPLFSTWKFIPKNPANQICPIWVTIDVPKNIKKGIHKIIITIYANGKEAKCEIALDVWDFELPDRMTLRTSFWYDPLHLRSYYKLQNVEWDMLKEFLKMSLDNHLTPVNYQIDTMVNIGFDPNEKKYSFDFANLKQQLEFILNDNQKKGNTVNLVSHSFIHGGVSYRCKSASFSDKLFSNDYENFLVQYLKAAAEFMKQNNWYKYAYIGYVDEPTPRYWDRVRWMGPIIKKTLPDIPRVAAMTVQDSMAELQDDIDIMCPGYYAVFSEQCLQIIRQQQAKGKDIWTYNCWKTADIDYSSIHHRIWTWLGWKYNSKGLLYWGLINWQVSKNDKPNGRSEDPNSRWPITGTWNGLSFDIGAPGDGYLIYPSPDGKPWSSIRLENIRDGIEDYEYMVILKTNMEKLRKTPSANKKLIAQAEKLLNIDEIVPDENSYSTDPNVFAQRRTEIAEMIEKMNNQH